MTHEDVDFEQAVARWRAANQGISAFWKGPLMDYEHVFEWTAKRAGGRITVYGRTAQGTARKLVGVDSIAPEGGRVIATDRHGGKFVLAL